MRRRPSTTPPVRRPPLPFVVDGETDEGFVFLSGGRWMVVASDELQHALYQELRARPAPDRDPVPRALGPAVLRLLN